jgi:hypothetical protein
MTTETIIKRGWFLDWAGQRVAYRLVEEEDVFGKPLIEAQVNPYGDGWHTMGSGRSEAAAKDEAIKAWNRFDMVRY